MDETGNAIRAHDEAYEKTKIVLFTIHFYQDHITITYNDCNHTDVPIPTKVDNMLVSF